MVSEVYVIRSYVPNLRNNLGYFLSRKSRKEHKTKSEARGRNRSERGAQRSNILEREA